MNAARLTTLAVAALASGWAMAAVSTAGTVELRIPEPVELTSRQAQQMSALALELVASANLNSVEHADLLQVARTQVEERYKEVLAGPHMVVIFNEPRTVFLPGGYATLNVARIVVGLEGRSAATAVFTIDEYNTLREHQNYAGRISRDLRKYADVIAEGIAVSI